MGTYGVVESVLYLFQPSMILAYTAAVVLCQVWVALILWSDQTASRQQ